MKQFIIDQTLAGALYPVQEGYGLVRKSVKSRNKNPSKSRKHSLSGEVASSGIVRAEKRQPRGHELHIRLTQGSIGKFAFCANGKQEKNEVMLQKKIALTFFSCYVKNSEKNKPRVITEVCSLCYWNYERTEIARNRKDTGPQGNQMSQMNQGLLPSLQYYQLQIHLRS